MEALKLIAVDPWDCGCNECTWGEYVPLRYATDEQVADLIMGRLRNNLNSGTQLKVSTTYATEDGKLTLDSVTVTYEHHDGQTREWSPDPYRMGLAA